MITALELNIVDIIYIFVVNLKVVHLAHEENREPELQKVTAATD